MIQLIKRDLLLNKWAGLVIVVILLPLAYISINLPITTLLMLVIIPMVSSLFYADDKSHSMRSVIAMPVAKAVIVRSRYAYGMLIVIVAMLYQWMIGHVIVHMLELTGHDYFVYDWKDMTTIVCLGAIVVAICIPLYHLMSNFYAATIVLICIMYVLWFTSLDPLVTVTGMQDHIFFNDIDRGYTLLVEKYLPFPPYLFLALGAAFLFFLSMKLSEYVFLKRDH